MLRLRALRPRRPAQARLGADPDASWRAQVQRVRGAAGGEARVRVPALQHQPAGEEAAGYRQGGARPPPRALGGRCRLRLEGLPAVLGFRWFGVQGARRARRRRRRARPAAPARSRRRNAPCRAAGAAAGPQGVRACSLSVLLVPPRAHVSGKHKSLLWFGRPGTLAG